jgi:hypothetical protein
MKKITLTLILSATFAISAFADGHTNEPGKLFDDGHTNEPGKVITVSVANTDASNTEKSFFDNLLQIIESVF